jgi:CubicO group peptidase (beta-lactamase class C family)
MIYIRLFLFTSLLFTLSNYANGQKVSTKTLSDATPRNTRVALEDYFQKAAGLGFSGAVLVAKDGKVIARDGYGWADVKRRIPITADTVFDIGSNTKVFTAIAIMQLEERGKLNTSDSVAKYFQNVPDDKSGITIHHLLTHTAGFEREEFYDESPPETREILKDREKYIQRILSFPLAFKPGEKSLYSNSGFSFLAAIVEQISGQSYETYLRENIFKPAGMPNTGYVIPNWKNKRVARGYNDGDMDYGFPWDTQWSGKIIPWDLLANGGLLSTVDDMYKFIVALQSEKLLSQKTKDKMFTVYIPERGQAYGWIIPKVEPGKPIYITHGGDAVPQGWNADIRWYKDNNLMAIVLSNKRIRAGSIRRYAMNHAADIALFNKPPQLPDFAEVKANKLRRLEGIYKLDSGASFRVKAATSAIGNGKLKPILIISGEGQQAIDLLFSANQLPAITKLSLELNDKTKAYIEALRKNDVAALKAILPDDSSAEEAFRRWNEFVKQNGELENIEMLGTSPLNQTGLQTFTHLKFKKADGFYHATWRSPKLHEQDEDRLQPAITAFLRKSFTEFPLNLPFLPKTETDFATYDLFKGRTVNVGFRADGNLVFHMKEGNVLAQKVKP